MEECRGQADSACYKNIAHLFATEYKMRDVLQVFEKNEQEPTFFQKCHTTLHFLGQEEYKMTKNVAKSLSEGTPVCFAGFFHGVLEEYLTDNNLLYNNSKLEKVLPTLCSASDNFTLKKNYNECLHGLGHALMFATDGELPQSLKLCDALQSDGDRSWCYSGSFMENSTSSTNKDHPSKYLKKDDPFYPCNILGKQYLNMCYTLQSFYFAEISKYNWKDNEKLCKKVPPDYQAGCFNAIGQNQVGFTQDLDLMKNNCYLMSNREDKDNCIYGVVGGLGERFDDGWQKVLTFCKETITNKEDRNKCLIRARDMSRDWTFDPNVLDKFSTQ